jgi:hypothetical protein
MTTRAMTNAGCGGLLAAAILGGCSGMSPERPAEPPAPIVARTDAASAAQCPNGGSVVSSGAHANGNGMLDDIEVATRMVVCMPAPTMPPGVVLRLVAEPRGTNCAAGGTAVQSGPDTDGNGRLDDSEVAHTEYACGEVLLTHLVAEPAGLNCFAGGVAFFAGRDRNADHVLDPGEIEVTEYDCGDTLSRAVDIESAEDVVALANIRVVTGDLSVGLATFDVVSLPRLAHIGGALRVRPLRLNRLSLPELREVDGSFTLGVEIAEVDCPQLARVGALSISTHGLRDLSGLSALARVDHDIAISGTFDLTSVDLSNLSIGGDLGITGNRHLTEITMALRDHVGFVSISSNGALEAVNLSVAPAREPSATMGSVDISANSRLAHLALGADRIESLAISSCVAVADVALEVAEFDGSVVIFDITTPFRLALSAPRGAAQIEFGGHLTISSALETFASTVPVIVDDLLVFDKTRLRSLDAGARIASARGGVRFSDNALLTEIAPFTLGGGLQLINNAKLSGVPLLPLLAPGDFEGAVITDNPMLTSVPSLAHVERVRFSIGVARNAQLGQLPLTALHWIEGDLNINDSPRLTSLVVPVLEHVAALGINRNPVLETLEAPALIDARDQLFIFQNLKLHHIVFDALASSENFDVFGNPKLPSCEVLDIFTHVSGFTHQSENDDTATCGD